MTHDNSGLSFLRLESGFPSHGGRPFYYSYLTKTKKGRDETKNLHEKKCFVEKYVTTRYTGIHCRCRTKEEGQLTETDKQEVRETPRRGEYRPKIRNETDLDCVEGRTISY